MNKIKDNRNRWRDIPCSWIGKTNVTKMTILPQSNLQIQCNPYPTTNDIFHRTRTENFTICMETQKTPNSQSSLEKEEWSTSNQPSWLQIILQSYSMLDQDIHQDSMVLAQKEKYRSMEPDRKPRNKPMHLWVPYFWQRRQEYTMGQRQPL